MDRADRHGVITRWTDALGGVHTVHASTVSRLHGVLGQPPQAPPLVVRPGAGAAGLRGSLHCEDGSRHDVSGAIGSDVPLGYHQLDDGGDGRLVIVVPSRRPM